MTERWEELKRIFAQAIELEGEARDSYVSKECGGDLAMRRQVEGLLQEHDSAPALLAPTGEASRVAASKEGTWSAGVHEKVGPYRLEERIDEGGSGVLFRATDTSTGDTVALKVFANRFSSSGLPGARFGREGLAAAKLNHPGIVRIRDMGEDLGRRYIVMDYVDAQNLARELRWVVAQAGGRPQERSVLCKELRHRSFPEIAATLVLRIAEALAHAHENGIIHRDVKPANILVAEGLHTWLIDFGIAKDVDEPTITELGSLEGTPNYMSPEQVRADRLCIDRRTDVYSLGVVFYELLTRQRPFAAATVAGTLRNITSTLPVRARRLNSDIPRDLETICHCAMEKRPEHRYASAGSMAEDIRRFLRHESIVAVPPGLARRLWRFAHRRRVALVACGLTLAVLWVGFVANRVSMISQRRGAVRTELRDCMARFDSMPAERIRAVLASAEEITEKSGDPGGVILGLSNSLRARVNERARSALAALKRRLDSGKGEKGVSRAIEGLIEALVAAGDLSERFTQELMQIALPTVELTWRSPLVTAPKVFVSTVDPLTEEIGAPEALDSVLEEPVAIRSGFYRFAILDEQSRFSHLFREIDGVSRTFRLEVWLRDWSQEDRAGVIRVEGGAYRVEEVIFGDKGNRRRSTLHQVSPFWIDAAPVTNGEYAKYLEVTERDPPRHWGVDAGDRTLEWDRMPVTDVTHQEAQAFAEWRGMRLPTVAEWEVAVRGLAGNSLPWRDGDPAKLARANLDKEPPPRSVPGEERVDAQRRLAWYVKNIHPVGQNPIEDAINGLQDGIGNVWEWTNSVPCEETDGKLRPAWGSRYRVGLSCITPEEAARNYGLSNRSIASKHYRFLDTGFRCVRSIDAF